MDDLFHSVQLKTRLCKSCFNCIKYCPMKAIYVRDGKVCISNELCIDCGECIKICPHHAKKTVFDRLDILDKYEYKVALPPPSLYEQINNLYDKSLVGVALKNLGFDDVFEVALAAKMASELRKKKIADKGLALPVISAACPSVVRLIKVKFPSLINNISPLDVPTDLAASLALEKAILDTGLPKEKIGIIFITPCPAKVAAIYSPMGIVQSDINGVIAMSEIYPRLLSLMKSLNNNSLRPSAEVSEPSLGSCNDEMDSINIEGCLSANGIENVHRVLENLKDGKLKNLNYIELDVCSGGCAGGVLVVDNLRQIIM